MSETLVVVGSGPWSGAYVLRIRVERAAAVVFGRYAGGAVVVVEPGDYLYIGSARSRGSAPALAHRVLRHLTRTGDRKPQPLRAALLDCLRDRDLPAIAAPQTKTLRWHIDYLLDAEGAVLTGALLVRDPRGSEQALLAMLTQTGATQPLRPGLGASDHPGHTHLLRWSGGELGWQTLIQAVAQWLAD